MLSDLQKCWEVKNSYFLVKNSYYTSISFSEDVSTVIFSVPLKSNIWLLEKMRVPQRKKRMLKYYKKCVSYTNQTIICCGHNMGYDLFKQMFRHFGKKK